MNKCCLALAAAALLPQVVFGAKPVGDLTGHWQLFVDDHLIASRENVVRRYHAFEKYTNNPIVRVDQPWEYTVVSCATVLPAEDGKSYRMWYDSWTRPGDPEPGFSLYATSTDGIRWNKPNLGLNPWAKSNSKDNNFVACGGSIMHTPDERDPALAYKSISPTEYRFSSSPDGLHWKPLSKSKVFSAHS